MGGAGINDFHKLFVHTPPNLYDLVPNNEVSGDLEFYEILNTCIHNKYN